MRASQAMLAAFSPPAAHDSARTRRVSAWLRVNGWIPLPDGGAVKADSHGASVTLDARAIERQAVALARAAAKRDRKRGRK